MRVLLVLLPALVVHAAEECVRDEAAATDFDNVVVDSGNHALVTSADAIGEATAVLPVVSTLVFGFAIAEILDHQNDDGKSKPVLCLLALSASLSLYTTTFSVLEL